MICLENAQGILLLQYFKKLKKKIRKPFLLIYIYIVIVGQKARKPTMNTILYTFSIYPAFFYYYILE